MLLPVLWMIMALLHVMCIARQVLFIAIGVCQLCIVLFGLMTTRLK